MHLCVSAIEFVMNIKTKTKRVMPVLLLTLFVLPALGAFEQAPQVQAAVFQLEVPELGIAPTDKPELTISTPNVKMLVVHVLRPQADNISPNDIYTFINGEATAIISDVNVTERGKVVRIKLDMRPVFKLVQGRNTVEVRAENRRGRTFYASYILRTSTENRNQDFIYTVAQGSDPKQQTPPELVLLEPETQVVLPRGRRSQPVRISGVATAATSIARVTVNNQPVPLNRAQVTMRKLGLANEDNRVTFDTTVTVTPSNMPDRNRSNRRGEQSNQIADYCESERRRARYRVSREKICLTGRRIKLSHQPV